MEKLQTTHAVSVNWRSYELRPAGSPPMPESYKQRIEAARPQLYRIARETYGLEMNPGPSGQNTRLALIGAKIAEQAGFGPAYHARLMRHYWAEGGRVDARATLTALAVEIGLDGPAFDAALDNPDHDAQVSADIEQAMAYGLSGVPAIVLNERYLLSGAQPYETLARAVEKVSSA